MIKDMDMGIRIFLVVVFIKETILMENLKELDDMYGQMDNSIKVNGQMDLNKVKECGKGQKEINMLENGNLEKLKVLEYINGSMVICIKVNLRNV